MKNIYEVLQEKEADIERLKGELQALRVVAALLEVELAPSPVPTYPTPTDGGPVANATKSFWPWGRLKKAPGSAA